MEIIVKGKVFSGEGRGRRFIKLPWVKRQIKEKMGFEPYDGTLNLTLAHDAKAISLLSKAEGLKIIPEKGYLSGRLHKALINEVCVAFVRPEAPDYPYNVLEIIAPISLREKFGLKDGDEVELKIWLE